MKMKRLLVLIGCVVVVGFGCALTLKAAIGVGAWDALAQTGNSITNIPVGTLGMVCNISCVALQIIILKKDFKPIQLLQIVVSVVLGTMVNFFLYNVLGGFEVTAYWMNIALLVLGYLINAFMVGAVMTLDIVTFALEGACMAVSKKTGLDFSKLRQGVDVVSIIVCLAISFLLHAPYAIREGTVIGMIMFGPLMGIFMKIQKPWFKKLDLID